MQAFVDGAELVLNDAPDIIFDLCWCARVFAARRGRKYSSYVYAMVSCLVIGYPGYTTSMLLAGGTPSIWQSNWTIPISAALWLVVLFSRLGDAVRDNAVLRFVATAGGSVSGARVVTRVVLWANKSFPGSTFAALTLGAIAGGIGGVLNQCELRYVGGDRTQQVRWDGMHLTLAAAAYFHYSTQVLDIVSTRTALVVVCLCIYAPYVLFTFFVRPIALFGIVERAFFKYALSAEQRAFHRAGGGETTKRKKT